MRFFVVLALVALAVSAGKTNGGQDIANAALGMVDAYPYSWGGGNDNGPTYGIQMEEEPYCDDRNVIGFDCSGLAKYAVYQGTGQSMYHNAQAQHDNCPNLVGVDSLEAGDLVFYGSGSDNIWHVAIYVGDNQIVEASDHNPDCTGIPILIRDLRTTNLIDEACRMW